MLKPNIAKSFAQCIIFFVQCHNIFNACYVCYYFMFNKSIMNKNVSSLLFVLQRQQSNFKNKYDAFSRENHFGKTL